MAGKPPDQGESLATKDKNTTPFVSRDWLKREGGPISSPDPVSEDLYLSYLGRWPRPFGSGPRQGETITELPRRNHRRASRTKSKEKEIDERALVWLRPPMITEKKGRCPEGEIDPFSPTQGLVLTSAPRCTSIRSSPRTPTAPLRANVRSRVTPRNSTDREGEGKGESQEGSS